MVIVIDDDDDEVMVIVIDDDDSDVCTAKFYIFRLLHHSSMRPSSLVTHGEHSLLTRVFVTVLQRRNYAIKFEHFSLEMIPQM